MASEAVTVSVTGEVTFHPPEPSAVCEAPIEGATRSIFTESFAELEPLELSET